MRLDALIQRHAFLHYQRHRENKQRNDGDNNQRQPPIKHKSHNHPAHAQKRRTDDQADEHSNHKLKLIDVVCQPIDKCRCTEAIRITV